MRQRIHREIFLYTCLLTAFLLPVYPRALPTVIIIMSVNWLISGIYLVNLPRFRKEKWRPLTLSFSLLYLLYAAGMLYSENFAYGRFDLEVKLSMLIFPLIFSTGDVTVFNRRVVNLICGAFLAGLFSGSLVLLGHAWLANSRFGVPDPFYYTHLAWYFHSSYLSMYFTLGICMILYYLERDHREEPVYRIVILVSALACLEAMVFLLSSKAGILVLAMMQGLFAVLLFFRKPGIFRAALALTVFALLFVSFSILFPFVTGRISRADSVVAGSNTLQPGPEDGTVARMAIWKISGELIRKNLLFGVGTGDVKDAYLQAYRQQGLGPVLKKRLNAHNQYFQTFVTLGLLGFLVLAASLAAPAWFSLRKRHFLYLAFLVIFALNMLFESMLESQGGVIFYAFFNVVFFTAAAGQVSPHEKDS